MPTKTPAKTEVTRTTKVPADAKKPTDHQPKAASAKPKVTSHEGGFTVTHRGATVQIDAAALNDYELLEDAAAEDLTTLPSVLRRLVGSEENYQAVKDACRDPETGRVLLDGDGSVAEFISDLFEALNPS